MRAMGILFPLFDAGKDRDGADSQITDPPTLFRERLHRVAHDTRHRVNRLRRPLAGLHEKGLDQVFGMQGGLADKGTEGRCCPVATHPPEKIKAGSAGHTSRYLHPATALVKTRHDPQLPGLRELKPYGVIVPPLTTLSSSGPGHSAFTGVTRDQSEAVGTAESDPANAGPAGWECLEARPSIP